MIVDVHTRLPTHKTAVPPGEERTETAMRSGQVVHLTRTIDDYLTAMEPVDKVFLFGIAPAPGEDPPIVQGSSDWPPPMNHNDIAAEVARAAPDKVIPFMSLHPEAPDVDDEYDRCVEDLGCRGIKLGPNYQVFDPLGKAAFHLYERLQRDALPVVFHQGTSPVRDAPLRYAHPLLMDEIALAFPELRIVMAHLGHPWHIDCLAVVRKHPNVWTDISGQFYRPWSFWNGMRLFHEWGVTAKILFASDWPVTMPRENIDGIRALNGLVAYAEGHRVACHFAENVTEMLQAAHVRAASTQPVDDE